MEPEHVCNCGPCQRFWQDTFRNTCLLEGKEDGSLALGTVGKLKPQIQLSVGDRVMMLGRPGSVKFVDFVDDTVMAPVLRVGIKLDESIPGGHDGVYQGKRYFHCTDGHGVFARVSDVVPLPPAVRRPLVRGNTMFPSWPHMCRKRREQEALLEEMQKKKDKIAARGRVAGSPRPPAISPRENKAHKMRRDMICMAKVPGMYVTVKEDPFDMAFKDQQQQGRKKDMLVASMSASSNSTANWERGLRKQWRQKYQDPEKVSRMGETLLKLCSAYKEGTRFKHFLKD